MRALAVAAALTCAPAFAFAQTMTPTPSPSPTATPSAEDEALLREIEGASATPAPAAATAAPARGSSGAMSNVYNPAMSLNGLFLANVPMQKFEHEEVEEAEPEGHEHGGGEGLAIQEVELRFLSNVDPYFTADMILAMHGEGIEIEEAILTPSWQPLGLGFRLGKLKLPFGRENTVHTHALPFIDKSLAGARLFGEEGLNEVGGEVSWLSPLPVYTLLTAAVFDGANEVLYAAEDPHDLAGLAQLKTVVDVTGDATLEIGGSYTAGWNAFNELSDAVGSHVTVKWRPARDVKRRTYILGGEAIYARVKEDPGVPATYLGGAYGYAQAQVAQRWHVGVRYDHLGFPAVTEGITQRGSAIVVFAPTEFSALRFQGNANKHPGEDELEYSALLQLNFTIGAHPAHAY